MRLSVLSAWPGRRMSIAPWALSILAFLLSLTGCQERTATVEVLFESAAGGRTPPIRAEIAGTPGQRSLGLMYRRQLPSSEGMLFVFPGEAEQSFWMKNTYIELDMIFLDSGKRVVSIVHRALPLTEVPRRSEGPAQYVLEVNGGLAEEWGLVPGDQMIVRGDLPTPE